MYYQFAFYIPLFDNFCKYCRYKSTFSGTFVGAFDESVYTQYVICSNIAW